MGRSLLLLSLTLTISVATAFGEHVLRIDSPSDGKVYTIDTDEAAVRRELHLLSPPGAGSKLPPWLYPSPGATPESIDYEPVSGLVRAIFSCGGTVEQVTTFHQQTLHNHGLRVSSLPAANTGSMQVTGYDESVTLTVTIQSAPRSDHIQVTTTWVPKRPPHQTYEAVWYDDASGTLRLRATSTGEEYEMDKRAIAAHNLNRPGAVASKGSGMPSWLPAYPRAVRYPKGKITWMFTPTAEFVTNDPVGRIYDYYLFQVEAAGATITSRGTMRDGKEKKPSAYLIAAKGDDKVEIHIGEVVWFGAPLIPKPIAGDIGIGIRYSVPQR